MLTDGIGENLILVTSSLPEEGKSFCCINLAIALAYSGQRTLLVDAHLRKPVLEQRVLASRGHYGLGDFLVGKATLSIFSDRLRLLIWI